MSTDSKQRYQVRPPSQFNSNWWVADTSEGTTCACETYSEGRAVQIARLLNAEAERAPAEEVER